MKAENKNGRKPIFKMGASPFLDNFIGNVLLGGLRHWICVNRIVTTQLLGHTKKNHLVSAYYTPIIAKLRDLINWQIESNCLRSPKNPSPVVNFAGNSSSSFFLSFHPKKTPKKRKKTYCLAVYQNWGPVAPVLFKTLLQLLAQPLPLIVLLDLEKFFASSFLVGPFLIFWQEDASSSSFSCLFLLLVHFQ
jgi:hypothetical protein